MISKIIIKSNYLLSPVYSVDKDNIDHHINKGNGIYICSFPDQKWHDYYGQKIERNYSIKKKSKMFACLNNQSILISPTEIFKEVLTKNEIQDGRIIHLSSVFKQRRFKQIEYSLRLLFYVYRNRFKIDFLLFYNFEMPIFFTSLIFKYILRKKIFVDFEDDYTLVSRSFYKNIITKFLFCIPDLVICINKEMTKHFGKSTECLVFNGFIDLNYTADCDYSFKENTTFLFAGTLDNIRGVDLLPEIVHNLKKIISHFKIKVSGTGPLEKYLKDLEIPEIEYLGFLSEEEYKQILINCDAFLVLQKPDHPFNRGSFPSKIEYFAEFKKPIYSLKILN